MKLTVFSDCHLFTPMEMNIIPKDRAIIIADNCYSIGDNYDRKGCEPKDAARFETEFTKHREAFDGRFIYGNHDLPANDHSKDFIKVGNVLLTHGDLICWDYQKSQDFRNEKPYQGYGAVKKLLNVIRKLWMNHISNFEEEQATKYCKQYGTNCIIYGHSHVSKVIEKRVNGIRIINVPRGRSILEV
jgi:predicted phosphodiesterase